MASNHQRLETLKGWLKQLEVDKIRKRKKQVRR